MPSGISCIEQVSLSIERIKRLERTDCRWTTITARVIIKIIVHTQTAYKTIARCKGYRKILSLHLASDTYRFQWNFLSPPFRFVWCIYILCRWRNFCFLHRIYSIFAFALWFYFRLAVLRTMPMPCHNCKNALAIDRLLLSHCFGMRRALKII